MSLSAGSDIDGHQVSYIIHYGGAKFGQKKFHIIGSAEPPRQCVVSITCHGDYIEQWEKATSFQEPLRIQYCIHAAGEG